MAGTGECSHCGECCRYIILGKSREMEPDSVSYLLYHGAQELDGWIVINATCRELSFNCGDGKYYCNIHETKPRICKAFKGHEQQGKYRFYVPKCCTMKE